MKAKKQSSTSLWTAVLLIIIMQYQVVLTFNSMDETQCVTTQPFKSYCAILACCTVCLFFNVLSGSLESGKIKQCSLNALIC